MSLAAGTRLGPYEIVGLIGAGGMGEVYKATDTRLERTVAVKVLSSALAGPGPSPSPGSSDDRRARFEREARTISGLNHPHICALYDVGDHEGAPFLVMEHVEGETLAHCLKSGPLPLRAALEVGAQIAEALEAAHTSGIVHRDLKPGNVMLTSAGPGRRATRHVKLLDFGLAKPRARDLVVDGLTRGSNPTRAEPPLTDRGVILGTVPYMAPEQLEGREADPRSDLWALGAILYEMVTGRRAFDGASQASLIGNIMNGEPPPLTMRQPLAPPVLDRVVRRCLAKHPGDRWQSAHDLGDELRWVAQGISGSDVTGAPVATTAGRGRRAMQHPATAIVAGVLLVAAGVGVWRWRSPGQGVRQEERELVLLTSSGDAVEAPALSPDGKMIALVAEQDGQPDLFVSRVAGGARVRLTNDAAHERLPAFSPDGERIAFVRREGAAETPNVLLVATLGGEAAVVARGAGAPSWSPDGQRLAVVTESRERTQELVIIALDGTTPRVILRPDAGYPFLRSTAWSPDGRQVVVERSTGGMAGEIWVAPVDGSAATRLSQDPPGVFSHTPRFTPDGQALIHSSNRGGSTNLWLLPIDGRAATRLTSGAGPDLSPSVAADGTVAFLNSRWRSLLVVVDLENGASRALLGHPTPIWAPAFSPDGREIAYSQAEADGQWHVWAIPAAGGTPRQLTTGAIPQIYPRYTPDGRSIVYCSWAPSDNRLYQIPRTGGPARALFANTTNDDQYADLSPDGQRIAFVRNENDASHIYVAPLDGRAAPRQLVSSQATLPRWSPDGRRIAFARDRSNESGIFVADTDTGAVRQLSATGGWPRWWRDGRQVAFLVTGVDDVQQIWLAPLDGGDIVRLASVSYRISNSPFDVSPDGRWLATTNGEPILSEIWLLKPGR